MSKPIPGNPIDKHVRIGKTRYELSDWIDPSIRPWEEGVYERAAPAGPYACWTGKMWRRDASSPAVAARQPRPSVHARSAWRGLAAPSGRVCMTCRGHGVVDFGIDPETGEDHLRECEDCA